MKKTFIILAGIIALFACSKNEPLRKEKPVIVVEPEKPVASEENTNGETTGVGVFVNSCSADVDGVSTNSSVIIASYNSITGYIQISGLPYAFLISDAAETGQSYPIEKFIDMFPTYAASYTDDNNNIFHPESGTISIFFHDPVNRRLIFNFEYTAIQSNDPSVSIVVNDGMMNVDY